MIEYSLGIHINFVFVNFELFVFINSHMMLNSKLKFELYIKLKLNYIVHD